MEKVIHAINYLIVVTERIFNKLPSWLLIFIPLASIFLSFVSNGNEEQYMQLAKQFVNPNWIFNSQNLTEVAGTRILYQLIIGNFLQFFSFEATVLIFRLFLILSFSLVLNKLYKTLSIDKFQIILHLTLFILVFNQSFFAGSWILISVEPKSFSYLAVLLSFYYILNNRLLLSLALLIFATYLHVLVGGYSFTYLLLTLLLFRKETSISLRQISVGAISYIILLVPFIFYLKLNSLNYEIVNYDVSPSWIYTYFRSAHHTALAKSIPYFFNEHFPGIIKATIGLIISIIFYPLCKQKKIRLINQFVIISLVGTLFLVSVAFIDKTGFILKFYLYRINTLSTFFLSLLIPIWIYILIKEDYSKFLKRTIIVISIFTFLRPSLLNCYQIVTARKYHESLIQMCEYIKLNTNSNSLIFSFINDLSITRRSERSLFVVDKFVPAEMDKLLQWYNRLLEKQRILSDPTKLKLEAGRYNINYILTTKEQEYSNEFKLIFENKDFSLYETGVKTP